MQAARQQRQAEQQQAAAKAGMRGDAAQQLLEAEKNRRRMEQALQVWVGLVFWGLGCAMPMRLTVMGHWAAIV
jgi:hypothetical protein